MKDSAAPRPPARRRGLHRCLALAAAVFLGLLPAVPAQANPSPAEIEAMIDKQWRQLEPTIEQYNKVRSELKDSEKKAAGLEKKIQPLSLQAELALDQVREIASSYYRTGPTSNLNALLASGSPTTLAEQLSYLDRLAQHQQEQIAGVVAVRDQFVGEKTKLDELIAQQKKQETELAARKKHIDAEIKRLQGMLPKTVVKVQGCPTVTGQFSDKARIAIQVACAQVGKPYVWGANGPNSFDCSGLLQYAWGKAGRHLTHYGDALLPGYGWIFGMGDGRVNVGLGVLNSSAAFGKTNYRRMLTEWLDNTPAEWGMNDEANADGKILGAALPMGFNRVPHYTRGVLLVGDTGGMVNPFNGEGIAYAMESGELAAEVAVQALARPAGAERERALAQYPAELKTRYGGYYRIGGIFVKLIGNPQVMRIATKHGLPRPTLMRFVLKLMANLTDPRDGDAMDRVINAMTKVAPAV